MKFTDQELDHCIEKATELSEQYMQIALSADSPQKSVDWLVDLCRTYCQKDIKLYELEIKTDDTTVWGACFTLDGQNKYHIAYVQGLNYCWKRFVICKELFHAVLENSSHHNLNLEEHVEEVTVSFPDDECEPSDAVKVEFLSETAAMEFLFPYAERQKELKELPVNNFNFLAIAEKYKVPQVMVERYLSKPYMEQLVDFNK